ncbi:MAG: hypothetical protein GXO73_04825 [Calditrichaeota bacterium]|nr:hypothetical protein [Calditrichota bacterium]
MVRKAARGFWILLLVATIGLAGLLAGCRGGGDGESYPEQEETVGTAEELSSEGQSDETGGIWKWDGDTHSLRNPFERPRWVRRHAEAAPQTAPDQQRGEAAKPVPLRLQGILYSQSGSKALINGRWVKVGDRVQGHRVVKIERTSVLLRRRNGSLVSLSLDNRR